VGRAAGGVVITPSRGRPISRPRGGSNTGMVELIGQDTTIVKANDRRRGIKARGMDIEEARHRTLGLGRAGPGARKG